MTISLSIRLNSNITVTSLHGSKWLMTFPKELESSCAKNVATVFFKKETHLKKKKAAEMSNVYPNLNNLPTSISLPLNSPITINVTSSPQLQLIFFACLQSFPIFLTSISHKFQYQSCFLIHPSFILFIHNIIFFFSP